MTDKEPTDTPAPTTALGGDDPRSVFAKAVDVTTTVIDGVRPDQLANSTPCGDMDVRALLGHLVGVLHRVAALGRAEDPFAVLLVADVADDAWPEAWRSAARDVQAAWSDDSVLERVVVLPWSSDPGGETLCAYVSEVTVHTWDLALATRQDPQWDDQVVDVALRAIRRLLPVADRTSIWEAAVDKMPPHLRGFSPPFANAVDVDPDAPLIHRLVAWNGRTPE